MHPGWALTVLPPPRNSLQELVLAVPDLAKKGDTKANLVKGAVEYVYKMRRRTSELQSLVDKVCGAGVGACVACSLS